MTFDPTKTDVPGMARMRREPAILQIIYDPNTGAVSIQSKGFRDCVEELGAFDWAKAMRTKVFVDAAGIGENKIALAGGALPPLGHAQ